MSLGLILMGSSFQAPIHFLNWIGSWPYLVNGALNSLLELNKGTTFFIPSYRWAVFFRKNIFKPSRLTLVYIFNPFIKASSYFSNQSLFQKFNLWFTFLISKMNLVLGGCARFSILNLEVLESKSPLKTQTSLFSILPIEVQSSTTKIVGFSLWAS